MRYVSKLILFALLYSCSAIDVNKETASGIRQYDNDSLKESINTLSKVIDGTDTCKICFLYRGFAYKDLEKYDEALRDFSSYIKIDKANPIGYANRASVFYMKNDYKSSLNDFAMAYRLDSSKILWNPICHMLFANGYKDSACIYYQKARALGDTTFDSTIIAYCNKKNYR